MHSKAIGARNAEAARRFGRVGVFLWGACMLFVISMLMLNHIVAMPVPSDVERLLAGVRAMQQVNYKQLLVHVIYQDCSCTGNLFRHLLQRRAKPETQERILFVGASAERRVQALAAGFEFEEITRSELVERFSIEAAPLFLVLAQGELQYVGGYYRTPATLDPQDLEILRHLEASEPVEPLPLYGCAVSAALERTLDPLGIRPTE